MLREQIDYLKNDIIHKNTLIEQLIINDSKSNNRISPLISADDDNSFLGCDDIANLSTNNNNSFSSNISSDDVKINTTSDDKNWQEARNKKRKRIFKQRAETNDCDFISENYYRTLIVDTESDFEKEFANNIPAPIVHNSNQRKYKENIKRPNPVVNNKQENDNIKYKSPKHIHGNTSNTNKTSGKKILISSDSICSRIKMKEFNRESKNGHAYRKQFPGATSQEMAHYCIPTLINENPDTVIIHTGTNDLRNIENDEIINNIMNIVELCGNHGAKNVYVSAITFREQFDEKVSSINNFLQHKQTLHNFTFIENNNITHEHIWKDKIHLNTHGTINIANNFINALNKRFSD